MEQYLQMARPLLVEFKHFKVTHIPIFETDALANLASNTLYPCNVELSVMDRPSIPRAVVIDHQVELSWMTPISEYLKNGDFLENRVKAVKVRARSTRYSIINGVLYRRSFSGPYLRCIPRGEVERIIEQVHQGVCNTNIGG